MLFPATYGNRTIANIAAALLSLVPLVLYVPRASSQSVWFKYEGNPVMDAGPAGSWQGAGVAIFRVLRENSLYRAWYSGNDGQHRRMGYATSRDGINWTRRTQPVLDLGPDGEWDYREATKGFVLFTDSKYHMWYHGFDSDLRRIGHAYSEDGIIWKKSRSANPVLTVGPALWEGQSVGFPCVLRERGGRYRMWYSGYDQSFRVQIGYAYAENPTSWKKHYTPVLSTGDPGSWDDGILLFPNVLFNGDQYEMWYGGSHGNFSTSRTGHATSPDGISWTKDPRNPVLTPGLPGSWDAQATYVGDVQLEGSLYRMWYGGFDGATERTGFAVSPKGTRVKVSADRMYVRPGHDTVFVSVRVANPYGLAFAAHFRSRNDQKIAAVELFDDGSHGDSLPGDGIFANWWLPAEEEEYHVDIQMDLLGSEPLRFRLDNAAEFTGVGPVALAGYELVNTKSPGPGDTILMKLDLRNQGSVAAADSVTASLSTTDRWITGNASDAEAYGTVPHGVTSRANGYYRFFISPNCPPGEDIRFLVNIASAGVPLWQDAVVLRVATPWWKTNWAYGLDGFLAIALFYVARRFETGRIRRKHEKEMERFQTEQLKKLDQLKSRFFANISHEFRTPLTLIRGPVEQMLSGEYKEDLKSQYEMILRNSRRLERLVNQLLDLSRLESGQMKIRADRLDLAELVRGVAAAFESLAKWKVIEFRIDCPPEPIIGLFDKDAVEKILTNLLSNAFKFTPEGGKVTVSVTPGRDRELVAISVRDTGIGIPAEEIDKVFDRFYQVDQSQTREYEGTGIGLALTKELVELHNGKITLESTVGEGSTFTVRLSRISFGKGLVKEDFSEETIAKSTQPPTQHLSLITSRMSPLADLTVEPEADDSLPLVLIIEDNADMRKYMRTHLDDRYRVCEAANGEEGERKALESIPDLIISDVMMPKMDGLAMCERLKSDERTSHIPVILLTAKAGIEHKLEGLGTGADDYLVKPFEPRELLARMKNLLELRQRLREKFTSLTSLAPREINATSMDEQFLKRALGIAETHIADRTFSVEEFAKEMFLSRMQLHRKVKALTGHSPWDLFRVIRLERARQMLQHHVGTIAEIADQVGYETPSHFAEAFRRHFGITPSDFVSRDAKPF